MTLRYPTYVMRDGQTNLGQDYFNRVLQDLDQRMDKLENLKASWEEAVRELKEFGLERIDATLVPVLQEAQEQLAESQAILTELQGLIESANIPAQFAAMKSELEADLAEDFADQTATVNAALTAQQTQLNGLLPLILAGL